MEKNNLASPIQGPPVVKWYFSLNKPGQKAADPETIPLAEAIPPENILSGEKGGIDLLVNSSRTKTNIYNFYIITCQTSNYLKFNRLSLNSRVIENFIGQNIKKETQVFRDQKKKLHDRKFQTPIMVI